MNNITYVKGNLFELAPKGAYLAHACNCQGVWGSGIAAEFRKRFPEAYIDYLNTCYSYNQHQLIGEALPLSQNIIALMTSKGFGKNKNNKEVILQATQDALENWSEYYLNRSNIIHMPKINSGLFGVPWEETEAILKKFDGKLSFVVYELEYK